MFASEHKMVKVTNLMSQEKTYWQVKDIATSVNLSEVHVRRLLSDGTIKGEKVGKVWIITAEAATRFINEYTKKK